MPRISGAGKPVAINRLATTENRRHQNAMKWERTPAGKTGAGKPQDLESRATLRTSFVGETTEKLGDRALDQRPAFGLVPWFAFFRRALRRFFFRFFDMASR